jgi:hypothetical protein
MAKYNEGNTVIVNNKGTNQVGVILGSSIQHGTNKRTVYDILLETRSVIAAVPKGAVSKQVYIDDTLTESLINSGKIVTTIPYMGIAYVRNHFQHTEKNLQALEVFKHGKY